MALKFNADKLLAGRKISFLNGISVDEENMQRLQEYKTMVRTAVKQEFSEVKLALESKNYAALSMITEIDFSGTSDREDVTIQVLKTLTPRFWTQGSMSYGTLNQPAKTPPQQIDIDDGVYLPMKVFEGQPVVAKDAFFKIVDSALRKLCSDNGWKHDCTKNTCSRIVVDDLVHIDVPLYAIPEEKFVTLESVALSEKMEAYDSARQVVLNPDEVYLAVRNEEHWKQSDPREVSDWFKTEVSEHGQHIKTVSRFLKAWRDYHWDNGSISSIALMACTVDTFKNHGPFDTLSEALKSVVENLSSQLDKVTLPVNGEQLYPKPHNSEEDKNKLKDEALNLQFCVCCALESATNEQDAVNRLIEAFGDRVPNTPELISINSDVAAEKVRAEVALKFSHPSKDMEKNLVSG